ncbi:hypothetical protein OIV83_005119 [Microbotryomycetes sp. JL201]|nr:hypothetical protein OIV83_005119 [Microbotryomycetes sp. JL201]
MSSMTQALQAKAADETLLFHPRRKKRLLKRRKLAGYSDSSDNSQQDSANGQDSQSEAEEELGAPKRRHRDNTKLLKIMGGIVLLLLVVVIGMGVYLVVQRSAERETLTFSNEDDSRRPESELSEGKESSGNLVQTSIDGLRESGEDGGDKVSKTMSTSSAIDSVPTGGKQNGDNKEKDEVEDDTAHKEEDKSKDNSVGDGDAKSLAKPKLEKQAQQALDAHNKFRAMHGVPPLEWDVKAADAAKKWFDNCVFEHSKGKVGSYGENLFAVSASGIQNPTDGINSWYSEIKDYDFGKGDFSMGTGHFTQLVWRGTRKIGCYIGTCDLSIWDGLNSFLVCEYEPAGNFLGKFRENVLPPK